MNPGKQKAPRQPADDAPRDILDLLARCVTNADDVAWRELLGTIQPLAKRTRLLNSSEHREEFAAWILGWPRLTQTIACAYKKVHDVVHEHPDLHETARQRVFHAYLTHIIHSAAIAFIQEQAPHTKLDESPDGEGRRIMLETSQQEEYEHIRDQQPGPADLLALKEQQRRLASALKKLSPPSRVVFMLTVAPDDLSAADVRWIAEQTMQTCKAVENRIEAARAANCDAQYPLSSQFIAELLGLQQDAVSQRVRRARLQLAALLGGAP